MKFLLLLSVGVFLVVSKSSVAQQQYFPIPLSATQIVSEINNDWNPSLISLDREAGDEFMDAKILEERKEQLQKRIDQNYSGSSGESSIRDELDTPFVWRNFQGNLYNYSVPNDNDIAVSNSGYVVSVMNSTIFMYDLNMDTAIKYISLDAFATSLGNVNDKYDPKAIYDPVENKFVVVFLAGFTDVTSSIIVAFSQNDFPGGAWNFYEIPGNPLNDSLWSDYPAIALTQDELFVTVNHLHNDEPWQTGWVRSVIWQIDKSNGYAGAELSTELHHEVTFDGRRIRNLCPVKGGSTLYGPDIYFLSERNLDISNDTFFLVHLTDTIAAPSQALNAMVLKSDVPYFIPINAKQSSGGDLATNDSRVLGAFYENDRIQFVGNTTDTVSGTAAIYHGVITDPAGSPMFTLHVLSDDTIHYGYPNLAYNGTGTQDNTAIIVVMRSAVNLFPGYSVISTDGMGSYSALKNGKSGQSYVSVIPGTERWGDYSGAQRRYDDPGKVWVNGSYGTTAHKISTWISEIALDPPPTGINQPLASSQHVLVFPNPAAEKISVAFKLDHSSNGLFELLDVNGRKVKTLLQERVLAGKNEFAFSTSPLPAGIYFLVVSINGEVICRQEVVMAQ